MHQYRYFGYATREVLHLKRTEQALSTSLVRRLEHEVSVPPDGFAPEVLSAQLQLLFKQKTGQSPGEWRRAGSSAGAKSTRPR